MRVRFLPEAEAELIDAARWYREQSPGLDYEFMRCVDDALSTVRRVPGIYPVVYRDLRKTLIRRFPYAIFFAMADEGIIVYAVFHIRRNPKRWKRKRES